MMRVATTLLLALAAVAECQDRFTSYARRYAPHILDSADFQRRLEVFESNAKIVDALNRENPGAEFSLDESPFSHMTFDEFSATRLPRMPAAREAGSNATVVEGSSSTSPVNVADVPTSWDWRTGKVPAVTSVKDQGALGSCWAFSATGNVEGQRAIQSQGATLEDLSVEQLIECDKGTGKDSVDGIVNADCGIFGGWPYLAYTYWMQAGGVRTAKEMPYCSGIDYGAPGACEPCMVQGYDKKLCGNHNDLSCNKSTTIGQVAGGLCSSAHGAVAQVKSWRRIANNATQIAAELAAVGPISVAFDATIAFQFYKRGVLNPKGLIGGCGSSPELNHAVLLVGFGSDRGQDYWIVKNSWGAKWGEQGFFRFVRGGNRCGMEQEATTAELA